MQMENSLIGAAGTECLAGLPESGDVELREMDPREQGPIYGNIMLLGCRITKKSGPTVNGTCRCVQINIKNSNHRM